MKYAVALCLPVWFSSVLTPALLARSQDTEEMTYLRRELQGSEMWFIETLDKLRDENNRRKIEEHVTQFRSQAESAFVHIETMYLDDVGGLGSAWLSRLDTLGKYMDELQKTKQWVRRIDYVVSLKDPKDKVERQQAMLELSNANDLRAQILKGSIDLVRIRQSNEALARAVVVFERIKDEQNLAYTHLLLALNAAAEKLDPKEHDEIIAAKDYWLKSGMSIESEQYRWLLEQLRELQKRGIGAPEPTPAAPPAAPPPDTGKEPAKEPPAQEWTRTPFKLKEDAKLYKLKTPALADEDVRNWQSFTVRGDASRKDGANASFPAFFKPWGKGVQMIRMADTFKLNAHGDAKTAERLGLTPGKPIMVTLRNDPKDLASAPYVFQLELADNEMLWGQSVPNAPAKEFAVLRFRTACKLEGTFEGKKWTLVDDNDSGVFGDVVQQDDYYAGQGKYFQVPDALFIGDADRSIPFSEYVVSGDSIHHLRIDPATNTLESQSAAMGKGWIKVEWAGPVRPECLIVVGQDDKRNCAYDIMAQEKTPVVSGRYRLAYGVLSVGKGEKAVRCLILPGKSESVQIDDGLERPMAFGAPFALAFSKQGASVVGDSIVVEGRGKEEYTRFNDVLSPLVSARVKDGKPLERAKPMEKQSPDDWKKNPRLVAYPKSFSVKKEGKEIIQFQLTLKNHPLFGDLESPWK
ncbi:MAG: hypothetical protein U1E76_05435 [Planctomycetota bacterium]